MNVLELIESWSSLQSKEVYVEGNLVSGMTSFLVQDGNADLNEDAAIHLPHPKTQDKLLEAVPVRVGGKFLYNEKCIVKGVVSEGERMELTPNEITIFRNEEYKIKFLGNTKTE